MRKWNELTTEEKFDAKFWFCYHVLEVVGLTFIFGVLCFGLILADAFFRGNF